MAGNISKSATNESKSKELISRIKREWISTRIIDDVFTDEIPLLKPRFEIDYEAYLKRLWEANPSIKNILLEAKNLEAARDSLFSYLEQAERNVFDTDNNLHILQKATIRECIRAFKSIIGPINEHRTGTSSLNILWKLANDEADELKSEISIGFIAEFTSLFRGVIGQSTIYLHEGEIKKGIPKFIQLKGKKAAQVRSDKLDELGLMVKKYLKKYPSGLEDEVVLWRHNNRKKILKYFGARKKDWNDYTWQLKHVLRTTTPILDLIELSNSQKEAIEQAVKNKIPFGITPYYLSLMDTKLTIGHDHAIRAQVLPPKEYVEMMAAYKDERSSLFDFMGEHDTSPEELITRRYPIIAILKPFNTCAQICVYCQRNWEIEKVLDPKAMAGKNRLKNAFEWFDKHKSIGDVLITGGDPLIMKDSQLRIILEELAKKKHIYRIRIGTRTPVVLPMRWTNELIKLLSEFHSPPTREIAIVTHFEHSYEITPEALSAVQKIKKAGISIYNQAVFTIENSRRFELAKLRLDLKSIGVDPYYTFNMKGKEETRKYMVPIARLLQERKEEARLLPGLDRTDEPVFNVPRLGKNHLRAWQDHRVIMIMPDGSRVYEFHPWEKNITAVPPYNYIDVPIYDYLEDLAARGENIRDYRTIWYYY